MPVPYFADFVACVVVGDQPGWMGEHNVLCAGCPFILGLDLLCGIDCGKHFDPMRYCTEYGHWHCSFVSFKIGLPGCTGPSINDVM